MTSSLLRTLLIMGLMTSFCPAQDSDLKSTLDPAYSRWRRAVESQDARAWAGSIRMYRQVVTRNHNYPPYEDGLPKYVRVKNVAVEKKLSEFKL